MLFWNEWAEYWAIKFASPLVPSNCSNTLILICTHGQHWKSWRHQIWPPIPGGNILRTITLTAMERRMHGMLLSAYLANVFLPFIMNRANAHQKLYSDHFRQPLDSRQICVPIWLPMEPATAMLVKNMVEILDFIGTIISLHHPSWTIMNLHWPTLNIPSLKLNASLTLYKHSLDWFKAKFAVTPHIHGKKKHGFLVDFPLNRWNIMKHNLMFSPCFTPFLHGSLTGSNPFWLPGPWRGREWRGLSGAPAGRTSRGGATSGWSLDESGWLPSGYLT